MNAHHISLALDILIRFPRSPLTLFLSLSLPISISLSIFNLIRFPLLQRGGENSLCSQSVGSVYEKRELDFPAVSYIALLLEPFEPLLESCRES